MPTRWERSGDARWPAGACTAQRATFVTLLTRSFRPVRSAFNNILSNLGYVMLGLLFLLIVLQRDIVHNRALVRSDLNALVRRRAGTGRGDEDAPL